MSVFDCLMLTWSSVGFFGLSTAASRVITCVVWHSQLANLQKCEETSTGHGPDHSCDPGMLSWLSLWLDPVEYIHRKCGQWLIPFSTLCFRTPPPSQRTYSNSDMWTLKWVISASVKLLGSELFLSSLSYLAEQGMIMKTKLTQSRTVEPYPLVNKISDSNLSYFYRYIGWVGQSPL